MQVPSFTVTPILRLHPVFGLFQNHRSALQGAELAEQVDGQEVSEEGQEGQQDEQAEAAEPGQDEEGGEYYDGQEGYPEDEAVEDDDEIARMMKGRGRKKAHEKSFEQMTQEVRSCQHLRVLRTHMLHKCNGPLLNGGSMCPGCSRQRMSSLDLSFKE